MPSELILPPRLRDALFEQALGSPQVEVCALLGGNSNRLMNTYPVRNTAVDPANRFLLEAEGQIAAMRLMRNRGETLRAIFHSHPTTPARPSATDRQLASYPEVYYLILSLADRVPVLRAYYYDGREFAEVSLATDG